MDLLLRTLWPSTNSTDISIPQYQDGEQEDNIELKVKALTYLFRRLRIEKLAHFNPTHEFLLDNTVPNHDKLDIVYNKEGFLRTFTKNEHRILIDWYKNKFRSIMILSDVPETANIHEKLGRNHRFQILRPDAPDDEYIRVLVNSDLFIEHSIAIDTKTQIIKEVLQDQKKLKPSFKTTFNKSDRYSIILRYLEKMSEHVQIDRIYQVALIQRTSLQGQIIQEKRSKEDNNRNPYPRSPRSPTRKSQITDSSSSIHSTSARKTNSLATSSSMNLSNIIPTITIASRSRSTSPVKTLRKKASLTLLKLDNSLNDRAITQSDSFSTIGKEESEQLYANSETAVRIRIERERRTLLSQTD